MQDDSKKNDVLIFACAPTKETESLISLLENNGVGCLERSLSQCGAVDGVQVPKVLLVGAGQSSALLRKLPGDVAGPPPFDLLIAFDMRVSHDPQILALARHHLIFPFSDTSVLSVVSKLLEPESEDSHAKVLIRGNIIGASTRLNSMLDIVASIAVYGAPVLLKGETGTGKELIARALHYCSRRCDNPFVPVNCGALTDELLIAELFGYEQGAFTDAKRAHSGYVEQADKGSLFLDEIDSLSLKAQSALLRFLQENEYRRLGSEKIRQANVRIICATNRDLADLVSRGEFREDLYYRLDVLNVDIPPLRERENDIQLLAEHFLHRFASQHDEPIKQLHPRMLVWMQEYDWPGNIRELENYIYRVSVLSKSPIIDVFEVKGDPGGNAGDVKAVDAPESLTFKDAKAAAVKRFEKTFLREMLSQAGGNVSEAARRSGTERRVFGRLLKKHGIDRRAYY